MTRTHDERCRICGNKTMVDWSKLGCRADLEEENEEVYSEEEYEEQEVPSILCQKCCKDKNFMNEKCYNCSEYNLCSGLIKEISKNWLDNLKGI